MGGTSVALAAVGLGAAGLTRHSDVAAARERALGATHAEGSSATGLRVLWRARTERKIMALTFDDGPGPVLTPRLLEVLRSARVRATFLVVGQQARRYPDLIRAQVRDGHEIGNHSWSHSDLSLLGYDELHRDLVRTDELLTELTGGSPAVVRPPYGRVNGALLQHVAIRGQQILLWDIRFRERDLDTAGNVARVREHLRPGTVLLAHDRGPRNRAVGIAAVPELIRMARQRGYEFVTASQMIAADGTGGVGS